MKFHRPFDFVIMIAIMCIAGVALLKFRGSSGSFAEVYVGEKKVAVFNLNMTDHIQKVETSIGIVQIHYGNGSIRVYQSPCPQKICILQGAIQYTHEQIICAPARLHIRIVHSKEQNTQDHIDAVTY